MGRDGESAHSVRPGNYRIRDLPERQRPREEMARVGAERASDQALVAVILRGGVQGMNVSELAQVLLCQFGSLTGLAKASVDELAAVRGMGKVKAQVLKAALELAKRLSAEATGERPCVRGPEDVMRVLREQARTLDQETFWVLLMDTKNRLRRPPLAVSHGILNASLVHPREVFREAIRTASAAVVLAHNHPSGDPAASAEDVRITRQLIGAGRVVDIQVLDHVIVGSGAGSGAAEYLSMREAGMVDFSDAPT